MTALADYVIEKRKLKAKRRKHGEKSENSSAWGARNSNSNNIKFHKKYDNGKGKPSISVKIGVRTVFFMWIGSFFFVGAFVWYLIHMHSNINSDSDNDDERVEYYSAFTRSHPGVIMYDRSVKYRKLREKYNAILPDLYYNDDDEGKEQAAARRRAFAQDTARKRQYIPIPINNKQNNEQLHVLGYYDPFNCPLDPPEGYPRTYNVLDVLHHWPPDDITPPQNNEIYQGLCVFSFRHDDDANNDNDTLQKILAYRAAEVPYVVRDDPDVLKTVERWGQADYLKELLGNHEHITEYSTNNHFMYWQRPSRQDKKKLRGKWEPPTRKMRMGYLDWLERANVTVAAHNKDGNSFDDDDMFGPDHSHWYFRLIGCGDYHRCTDKPSEFLFDELPYFRPWNEPNLYLVDEKEQQGMHCRFGMKGVIAENHFDASRNSIALLGGERRYILAHPRECENLALYPMGHPSRRHSAIDWSNPDLQSYPQFGQARVNEIVLQAGDVMYLPTEWFHYIISLELNFQCNIRSGRSDDYDSFIDECGFGETLPK